MASTILRSPNLADGAPALVVRLYEKRPPSAFKNGGLASVAHDVRSAGRGGDDILLHINPEEYAFLRKQWGEPSKNPHTGLPEYGLFSKLKKALKFENFNVKGIVKDIAKNPQRLLTGAVDPLGTRITNKVFGTNYKPAVNQLGGATKQRFQDAQAKGMDTGTAQTLHKVAAAVAAYYALGAGFGGGTGAAGAAGGSGAGGLGAAGAAGADGLVPISTAALDSYVLPASVASSLGDVAAMGGSGLSAVGTSALDSYQLPASVANSISAANPGLASQAASYASNYAKDPKNWGTIAKGAGLLGGLAGAGATGQEPGGPPPAPTSPGLKQLAFNRQQGDQNFDWYTYGQGPEKSFYNNNALPSIAPGSQPDPNAYMGGVPGAGFGQPTIPGGATGGHVRGPGTGRSDSIDAKLSDGEYVLTAEDVSLLGDGSSQAGARRLDLFRKNLRKHKGGPLARGKISPNAKSPMSYLKGAR